MRRMTDNAPNRRAAASTGAFTSAFTLVELLVVIGIIALLVGILVPTVSRVRQTARVATTSAFIQQLSAACEAYAVDLGGYPGPIPNRLLGPFPSGTGQYNNVAPPGAGFVTDPVLTTTTVSTTGTENLVLGLLGGLLQDGITKYDPTTLGQGPLELRGTGLDKRNAAYFTAKPADLSWRQTNDGKTGRFADVTGQLANDTIIPEFVDGFADPLPILYLRANRGVTDLVGLDGNEGQYTVNQVIGYTGSGITVGGDPPSDSANANHGLQTLDNPTDKDGATDDTLTKNKTYGFTAYFENPDLPGEPRQKDGFILISAGRDRIYGTRDDITNFGGF